MCACVLLTGRFVLGHLSIALISWVEGDIRREIPFELELASALANTFPSAVADIADIADIADVAIAAPVLSSNTMSNAGGGGGGERRAINTQKAHVQWGWR
jgi:hypothetical protein